MGLSGVFAGLLDVGSEIRFAIGLRDESSAWGNLLALRILLIRDLMSGFGFAALGYVDVGRLPWSGFLASKFVRGLELALAFGAPV